MPAAPDAEPTPTELLRAAQGGDAAAADAFARLVQGELRTLAASYLRRERAAHTLQPTALVNEAYLRLLGQERVAWQGRAHFFGVAAQVMRRVLVDHARRAQAAKRDVGLSVTLDDGAGGGDAAREDTGRTLEVLAVHDALARLERLDPRQARIVELRFFVGLTLDETAAALGVSRPTVWREWTLARAWLAAELGD